MKTNKPIQSDKHKQLIINAKFQVKQESNIEYDLKLKRWQIKDKTIRLK